MSGSLNRAQLIGHLGQDPEIKSTQSGERLAQFSVATSERWKDRTSGEQKERTEWHRIVIFDERLVEVAERYLKKGALVLIEGKIRTRKWQAQDGQDRYSTEIVLSGFGNQLLMLDKAPGNRPPPPSEGDYAGRPMERVGGAPGAERRPDLDDEIPF
jgi:single-strand DNA-binding protein